MRKEYSPEMHEEAIRENLKVIPAYGDCSICGKYEPKSSFDKNMYF